MQKNGINYKNSQKHALVQLYMMEINGEETFYQYCVTFVFSADAHQSMSNDLFHIIQKLLEVEGCHLKSNFCFALQILL